MLHEDPKGGMFLAGAGLRVTARLKKENVCYARIGAHEWGPGISSACRGELGFT